jgi:acetolactate synthase-1/2/3 large subunit
VTAAVSLETWPDSPDSAPPLDRSALQSMVVPAPSAREAQAETVSEALVASLVELGVTHAFGLLGGAIVPFATKLPAGGIDFLHYKHESGAIFAAAELSIASGRPVVVVVTTGPGLTNCLTGCVSARWEGAKVILVSPATSPVQRGRWAFQETSAYTTSGPSLGGNVFHYAVSMDDAGELDEITRRLKNGVDRPGGFIAHVSLPLAVQSARAQQRTLRTRVSSLLPPSLDDKSLDECVARLSWGSLVIWTGFGARDAAAPIRALAERTGARVITSPRGKGIFPEDHPQFLGVTGLGGQRVVEEYLAQSRPDNVLVLGTRLGESTSAWRPELVPLDSFVHVDVDPEVFGVAYPEANTLGITCDVATFVSALLSRWPAREGKTPFRPASAKRSRPHARTDGPVRPSATFAAIQKVIVEGSLAMVLAETGRSMLWGSHELRFTTPNRYRVSTGFGAMGHFTCGVVGAAIARGEKAVAVVGDGAMLMQNELHTAVQYGIPAVWIVLNDALYGMVDQGMKGHGHAALETELRAVNFADLARATGATGIRVERESDLEAALVEAMNLEGPVVVDIITDPYELAPLGHRNNTLTNQLNGKG